MGAGHLAAFLIADGRFPAGGHAHSAGIDAAVCDGRVHDLTSLGAYLEGRLWTAGLCDASLAAATVLALGDGGHRPVPPAAALAAVDAEADARVVSPPLRLASRRLGHQLLRAASRCWPCPRLEEARDAFPSGLHQPVALGAVAVAAGIGARGAADLAVHHALATPAQAGVRLLGLDPFGVSALVARLGADGAVVADRAVLAAEGPLRDLPAGASPLIDIASVDHQSRGGRMFVT